jgi:hypothetical protein
VQRLDDAVELLADEVEPAERAVLQLGELALEVQPLLGHD